jgi:hypothetical protein
MSRSTSSTLALDPILTSHSSSTPCRDASTETTDRSGRKRSTAGLIVEIQEPSSEYRLWRNVLGQTIRDVCDNDPKVRHEVVCWMLTEDFDVVCGLAHAHAEDIREQLYNLATMAPALAKKFGRELREKIVECP